MTILIRTRSLAACLTLLAVLFTGQDSGAAKPGADVLGKVTIVQGDAEKADRSGVVVYIRGVKDALPDTSKLTLRVAQQDKQFTPAVSVALLGSSIEFPNNDKIFHNVFSLSKIAHFDLGLYKAGA